MTKKKLIDNLYQTLLQFFQGRRYTPMTEKELFKRLDVPPSLKEAYEEALSQLIQSEQICLKKDLLCLPEADCETAKGILKMHARGFGFVIPDSTADSLQDIFIPKHLTNGAVDSDHVEVQILPSLNPNKGPEGKVLTILKRAREHVCGIIYRVASSDHFLAHVPLLGSSKPVTVLTSKEEPLNIGDRVVLQITDWGSAQEETLAQLSYVIGSIDDPSCDIKAAIEEFDLPSTFPRSALTQAKEYGTQIPPKEKKKRVDLTHLEAVTIDPDTAKDFDDALSLTQDRDGTFHLGVHIADAAHYVTSGSALDKQAFSRANSTYLPGTCVPMLPEELSNELCSLQPHKIRLTVSVLMDFNAEGNLMNYEVVRAFIESRKRFTYFEAKDVLDGKKESPHEKLIKRMEQFCLLLKKQRQERGSIDFSLSESVLLIGEKGEPLGFQQVEYDITHQLVEEFMLKANETVATFLHKKGKGLIYRVHEEPSKENFDDFLNFGRQLGFHVPTDPKPQDIQNLFKQAKDSPFHQQLSVAFIRSMRLAQYSPDNMGHFGLALEHYCHFTSPIRRYSDLVIQRLLFDEEEKEIDLEEIARHCSSQERVSFKAEVSVKTLKKLRLLKRYFEEDPNQTYTAFVSRVKPFGLFFEIRDFQLEGSLHISEIGDDYFVYEEKTQVLTGRHNGKTYQMGDPITVQLARIDLIEMQTDWMLPSSSHKKRRGKRRRV